MRGKTQQSEKGLCHPNRGYTSDVEDEKAKRGYENFTRLTEMISR